MKGRELCRLAISKKSGRKFGEATSLRIIELLLLSILCRCKRCIRMVFFKACRCILAQHFGQQASTTSGMDG